MSYGGLGEENKSIANEMILGRERIKRLEALVVVAYEEGYRDSTVYEPLQDEVDFGWNDSLAKEALEGTDK